MSVNFLKHTNYVSLIGMQLASSQFNRESLGYLETNVSQNGQYHKRQDDFEYYEDMVPWRKNEKKLSNTVNLMPKSMKELIKVWSSPIWYYFLAQNFCIKLTFK